MEPRPAAKRAFQDDRNRCRADYPGPTAAQDYVRPARVSRADDRYRGERASERTRLCWKPAEFRMDIAPAHLYKYFPPARCSFFQDRRVRFTQPGGLNDPFELRPHVESVATDEEELEVATRNWERFVRRRYDELVLERGQLMAFADYRASVEKLRDRD